MFCKHEDPSLNLQHPRKKPGMSLHAYNISTKDGDSYILRVYWANSLANTLSFSFSERPCLKEMKKEQQKMTHPTVVSECL